LQVCHNLPAELLHRFPSEVHCIFHYYVDTIFIDCPEVKLVRINPDGSKHYEMAGKADPKRWHFEIRPKGNSYSISLVKKKGAD
jgi:hypothetical protein